jgi:hypothetical protein
LELSVSCFLIASNGLQSYVLGQFDLKNDREKIELVFLAYADDIAVAVSSDPRNGRGLLVCWLYEQCWLYERSWSWWTDGLKKMVSRCQRRR